MTVRGPTDQQRVVILGRTGSGKSQMAIALLSTRNFDEMPWVVIDYKGEDLLIDIRKATGGLKYGAVKNIKPTDDPPHKPGLYYMHPRPIYDDEAVKAFLFKCFDMKRGVLGSRYRGNIGLFVDEGYTLPQNGPFEVILTQGRTLYIPVIVLYQRPVWMSRFAVAQADFFAYFAQSDERDQKVAKAFIKPCRLENGTVLTTFSPLPAFHYLWHDVGEGITTALAPAPPRNAIIEAFQRRLTPRRAREIV